MNKILILFRGIPGAGKTTLAKLLLGNNCISADEMWEYDYNTDEDFEYEEWQVNTKNLYKKGLTKFLILL